MKIAIIGATGMLGQPVAKELAKAFDVTALVRDEAKAKSVLPGSIRLVKGDLKNPADLSALLKGQDALYINLNLDRGSRKKDFQSEREGLDIILQAARAASIRRIAFISSVVMNYQGMDGFNWWVFELKHNAVKKIRESGIPYTIFYPSTFMENFETTYRQGNKILLAGQSLHKMYFIAGQDYGRQVARSFQILKDQNKEYVIQGTEGFTAGEAAEEYVRHYSKEKLVLSRAPLGLLKILGMFSASIDYGYHIITALNKYPEKFEALPVWEELGKPEITLKQFAQR